MFESRKPTVSKKFVQNFYVGLFSLALAVSVQAQDDLSGSVYGGEKTKTKVKATNLVKPRSSTKNTTPKRQASTPKVVITPSQPKKPKANPLTVTFITKEPSAQIWLNDKMIGLTDESSKLTWRLTPGDYRVMVKNKIQVIYPVRKITVSPAQTEFKLFNEAISKQPMMTTMEASNKKPASEFEMAVGISAKIKQILEDYTDPAKTDSVTADDWEIVFQAAQLGQLQGFTAVQIEAQRWFASGQIELAKSNYPSAFTAFNKSIEFMPNSPLPFYGLGNTYYANNQASDALKSYQKALQLDSKSGMIYKKLGDTQRVLGKEKEAIASYKAAIQNGYNTPETRFRLAATQLETKQTEEGLKELEEIVKTYPTADVYISIGEAYEKLKRDVSALENYQQATKIDPKSSRAFYKLGTIYYEQREYTKAKEAFAKAIELDADGKMLKDTDVKKKLRETESKINK